MQGEDLSNGVSIMVVELVVLGILPFEFETNFSLWNPSVKA